MKAISFTRPDRYWIAVCMTGMMWCLAYPACAENSSLTFSPIRLAGRQVTFDDDCRVVSPAPTNVDQFAKAKTDNGKFTVFLDPDIKTAKFGGFLIYPFYVEDASSQENGRWERCSIQVTTVGKFVDELEAVPFVVHRGTVSDKGTFNKFPIHCDDKPNLISVSGDPKLPTIDLNTHGQFQVLITNLSSTLEVTVNGKPGLEGASDQYWENSSFALIGDGSDVKIGPGETARESIHLQPKRLQALLLTLHSFKGDAEHTQLSLLLSYHSDKGGSVHSVLAPIGIRFAPSFPHLLFALLAGSLLGTLAGQFAPKVWNGWSNLRKQVAKGLLYSVVAEIIGLLMVGLGSKLVLLNFELDPWQLLPVGVIGLIVSGGKELIDATGIVIKRG